MKNLLHPVKNTSFILLSVCFILPAIFTGENLRAQDKTAGKTISSKKFQRLMKKKNTVLLDVRTSEEYKAGHIPGAKQIDVLQPGNFEKEVSGFNKKKTYLLYCKSGKRSNNAKVMMKELGFSKLFDLKGGYSQWPGRTELK